MKDILNRLFAHEKLEKGEARESLLNISEGKYSEAQVAVFMGVYMMRSISVEELRGFRDALLELCHDPGLEPMESIDLCGTGGDGKNTFNISTCSSFVVAGAGYTVCKHGNYGVSSMCGSSNVLESLGYRFSNNSDKIKRELDKCKISFLHAPLFHPAMKFVAPIRRDLGVKTFFNMLGPLVNPARTSHQNVGVFSIELARLYKYIFEQEDKKFNIVHALDGYDEVSLTGDCLVMSNQKESILSPGDFGFSSIPERALFGGESIEDARKILVNVLNNESTLEQKNAVIANSALAVKCFENNKSLLECVHIATESLDSGAAYNTMKKLLEIKS